MKLRIVHESWAPEPFLVERGYGPSDALQGQMMYITAGPRPTNDIVWRELARFLTREEANRWADLYATGRKVVAEFDTSSVAYSTLQQFGKIIGSALRENSSPKRRSSQKAPHRVRSRSALKRSASRSPRVAKGSDVRGKGQRSRTSSR